MVTFEVLKTFFKEFCVITPKVYINRIILKNKLFQNIETGSHSRVLNIANWAEIDFISFRLTFFDVPNIIFGGFDVSTIKSTYQ